MTAAMSPIARPRVLIVDDEPHLRNLAARILRNGGYDTVDADDPGAALQLAADPAQRIDAVLTDVRMPGTSGPELVGSLIELRPGLAVVFMSGDPGGLLQDARWRAAVVVAKPFESDELILTVSTALSTRRQHPDRPPPTAPDQSV